MPLGKRDDSRGWWMKPDPARTAGGHDMESAWAAPKEKPGSRSSRSPAARINCACIAPEMGWPIVGDTIYGSAPRAGGPGLHLLSREIVVPLYKNRDPVKVTAPVPPHMREGLLACGWIDNDPAVETSAAAR